MGKRIAIVQSNYIPWKGYFDLIAAVDEFILYDDAQFTKNDWRNRNRIKTPAGPAWLSIPVGPAIHRRIRDVAVVGTDWRTRHWKTLQANYGRAPGFSETADWLEPIYLAGGETALSAINRRFIEAICARLDIRTRISWSWDYRLDGDRVERLAGLCEQAGADAYLSGPAARQYLDEEVFRRRGITVGWFDYAGYPTYPQLWGDFCHEVSVLDLLFNCGSQARRYMKCGLPALA
jgi:hypothetical protein